MSATINAHLASEGNKTLGAILDRIEQVKDLTSTLDLQAFLEKTPETTFITLLDSLKSSEQGLAGMTLTLVAAKALSEGEELDGRD